MIIVDTEGERTSQPTPPDYKIGVGGLANFGEVARRAINWGMPT